VKRVKSILLTLFVSVLCVYPTFSTYSSTANENITFTNWPLARMDSRNSGFTAATFSTTMKFDTLLPVKSFHAPIIANQRYYLIELETNALHCYQIENQNLLWKRKYSQAHVSQNVRIGNTCAFSEATNQVLLLETIEGNWFDKTGFVSRLYAINPANGNVNWQQDIEGYYANSMVVSNTEVYAKVIEIQSSRTSNYLSHQHKIASFSLKGGEKQWISRDIQGGSSFSNPNIAVLDDDYVVTSSYGCIDEEPNGNVLASSLSYLSLLDKKTGTLLDTEVIEGFSSAGSPLLKGNQVFLVATSRKTASPFLFTFSISYKELQRQNHIPLSDTHYSYHYLMHLAQQGKYVYFLDYSGLLSCISTDSGAIKWKKKVGSKSKTGPFFCNEEYLIVCTQSEEYINLQYFSPDNGAVLFTTSARFIEDPPRELVGTDNHIWVVCKERWGGIIAHFTTPPPPSITVTPLEIQDTCWEGETECFTHTLSVTSSGNVFGPIECGDSWIHTDINRVKQRTNEVHVTIDPSSQSVGTHSSTITFDTNIETIIVSVTLTVLERPKLSIIPTSVEYKIHQGDIPPPTLFHVENTGGPGLEGSLSCQESWIQLSEHVIDDSLMSFTATYHTESLSPGIYKSTIVATSNGGNQTIPIVLTVVPKPHLVVTPMHIRKQVAIGSSESDTLFLSNTGGPGLSGTITSSDPWLLPSVNRYHDETQQVQVYLNAHDLQAGIYHGTLTFTGNDQVIVVPVTLECIVWITFRIGSTTVEVNKVKETIEAAPYLFQKRSYVPVRKLVESLPVVNYLKNAQILWNPEEQKVTLLLGEDLTVELWVDQPMAHVNGKETPIDPDNLNITPQIRSGRTFLPLRFISETLGYTVEWIGSTQTIHVKYIVQEE